MRRSKESDTAEPRKREEKLSWEETYKQAAREHEDWSDLESTLLDGLDEETP